MSKSEFAPDDHIDSRVFGIAERVFNLSPDDFFASNDTTVEELAELTSNATSLRGHTVIKSTEIPINDRMLYPNEPVDPNYYVWYPPFTDKEIRSVSIRARIGAVRRIERAYGIKMKDFKNIDKHPTLTLSQVAHALDSAQLQTWNENHNKTT